MHYIRKGPSPQPPTAHPPPPLLWLSARGQEVPAPFWDGSVTSGSPWESVCSRGKSHLWGKPHPLDMRHVGQAPVSSAWPPLGCLRRVSRPATTPAPLGLHLQSVNPCVLSTGCRKPHGESDRPLPPWSRGACAGLGRGYCSFQTPLMSFFVAHRQPQPTQLVHCGQETKASTEPS